MTEPKAERCTCRHVHKPGPCPEPGCGCEGLSRPDRFGVRGDEVVWMPPEPKPTK